MATGSATTRGGIAFPASGATARPTGSTIARTVPPPSIPTIRRANRPGPDFYYVPGQYFPDGDGVVWKPGFWAKVQPGWAWVPAQWVHQAEGWTFQEGYWDRTLEDRGTLFAPAQVAQGARNGDTVYQPYSQISPQSYGLLYGGLRPA